MHSAKRVILASPLVACLATLCLVVSASLDPDQYFRPSSQEAEPFIYPTVWVLVVSFLTLIETGGIYVAIRPWGEWPSVRRIGVALLVFSAWFFLSVQMVVHMPGFVLVHHVWLLCVGCTLGVGFAATVGRRFYHRKGPRSAAV